MLDSKDLLAISEIVTQALQESETRMASGMTSHMNDIIQESEERMTSRMNGMIQESEERMSSRMNGMIQESEERMTSRMNSMIQGSEERMSSRMNSMIQESEEHMISRMEKMLFDSEVMLLKEMDRYDKRNEKRFAKIEQELDNLKDICRITKNEQETITILLHTIEKFDNRLTAVEMKTA